MKFITREPSNRRLKILLCNLMIAMLETMDEKELHDYLIIEIGMTEDEYNLLRRYNQI